MKCLLSVMTFSKDDVERVLALIESIYSIADEVVLIDSSSERNRRILAQEKKKKKMNKLKIYYVVPLGYPDPTRMYALGKCKGSWVLHLDSDETINKDLKRDIRNIVSKSNADCLLMNRVLCGGDGSILSKHDMVARLFKRGSVSYSGMIHEYPKIAGLTKNLPQKYSLLHTHPDQAGEWNKFNTRYIPIEMLTYRMTYRALLGIIAKKRGSFIISAYLRLKASLCAGGADSELSKTDYRLFALLQILSYMATNIGSAWVPDFGEARKLWRDNNYKIDRFFEVPPKARDAQLALSNDIASASGIIPYLGLYSERKIREMNRRYAAHAVNGVEVLKEVLMEEYAKRKVYRHGRRGP